MSSLKKNIIYQVIYQVLIIILPLITTPYVARVLGKDNSGIYSFTNTIANYFVVFGMLGLEQYGNRSIAKVRDNQSDLNRVFSELLILHIIVSLAAIVTYALYCIVFVTDYKFIFFLQGFYVLSSLFDINWFFFGIEKFKLTVTRNIVIKAFSFICIFVFVKEKGDLSKYAFILSFSMLLSQIAVWPMLKKYVKFVRVPLSSIKKHWKPLLVLFVAVIAANLNRMIDKAMLGWFDKISDLGCYDYADRIIRVPLGFIAAIGTVMLSKMSNLFAKDDSEETKKILDISACLVLMMSIGMGFGIAAIAPEFIILFLGKEYQETAVLLTFLSLSIPLVGWNNFIRTQILIPREMDMVYTRAVTIGALVNIITNCGLIYFLGARGASIATVISYATILVIQMLPLAREMRKTFRYIAFPLLAGGVMYGAVRLGSLITDQLLLSVCIELLIGVVVYGGLSLLYLRMIQPQIINVLINKGFSKK